jgi:hypothetical protein
MDFELLGSILILSAVALSFPVAVGLYYRVTELLERQPEEQPENVQYQSLVEIDYDLLAQKIVDELIRRRV